jgi:hypothetical protein
MGSITKTVITVELGNGGWATQSIDTIEIDGCFWLVPLWTLSPDKRSMQPLRIVSMTMADTGAPAPDRDAFQGLPIPESILSEGHVPLGRARLFLVHESPDIWLPNPDA